MQSKVGAGAAVVRKTPLGSCTAMHCNKAEIPDAGQYVSVRCLNLFVGASGGGGNLETFKAY